MQRKIRIIKFLAILFIIFFVLGVIMSFIIDVNFTNKFVGKGNTASEERLKTRLEIFQNQIFYLSIFFGLIGVLMLLFSKKITRILSKRKELFVNIFLLLIFLMFLMLIMELVLRIFFSQQIYSEHGFGPGGTRFHKNMKFNSLGYRDVEHSMDKADKFRIIVIGDSYTVGYGINNLEDVYTRVLQKRLNEAYGENKFEIISLAEGGYSTIDEVRILKDIGLNMSPDLIVLGYHANDAEGPGSMIGFEKLFFHHYLIPYELGYFLYRHSFAYYFLESRLKNLLRSFELESETYEEYIRHLYSDSNPFKEHSKYLREFIKTGKDRGIPVIIINFPVTSDFNNYPFYYVNEHVKSVALLNGADYIDLLPYFAQYGPERLRVSFLDAHMNELGHKITADIIFKEIQAKKLIKNAKK